MKYTIKKETGKRSTDNPIDFLRCYCNSLMSYVNSAHRHLQVMENAIMLSTEVSLREPGIHRDYTHN